MINKIKQFIENIKLEIYCKTYNIKNYLQVRKYKRLYPDYVDDEYNCGSLKFIWGIKSWDDLTGKDASLFTMNDIDIIYDRDSKLYMLGIETIYTFKENKKENECKYLRRLLETFTKYMNDNNYSKNYDVCIYAFGSSTKNSAESIEKLYFNFKVFVEGYCKVYGY